MKLLLEYFRNHSTNIFCFLLPFAVCWPILSFQPIRLLKITRFKSGKLQDHWSAIWTPNINRPISVPAVAPSCKKWSSFLHTSVLWGKKEYISTYMTTERMFYWQTAVRFLGVVYEKTMSYVQTVSVRLSVTFSWITFQNYTDHLHRGLARG